MLHGNSNIARDAAQGQVASLETILPLSVHSDTYLMASNGRKCFIGHGNPDPPQHGIPAGREAFIRLE
jgi:hypothetical protein